MIFLGGEAVDPSALRKVFAANPPRHVMNTYGPAEGTTQVSWHPDGIYFMTLRSELGVFSRKVIIANK